jgi:hypothetical protein
LAVPEGYVVAEVVLSLAFFGSFGKKRFKKHVMQKRLSFIFSRVLE